jgi:protein-L-isoaspartate(D-aspartate) O-methyltransferase
MLLMIDELWLGPRAVLAGGIALACLVGGGAAAACAVESMDVAGQRPAATETTRFDELRTRMVEEQIRDRGIDNERVLAAMRKVPRHRFVPQNLRPRAYDDSPLPIGLGQTISQPYIVAYMTEALEVGPTEKVLEVGTGSGYQAAVLAEIVREVYTIEIVPALAENARAVLDELGYTNVRARVGDGYGGWPDQAPFDGIIVTAAPDHIPQPLVDQLAVDGRMVLPVGEWAQEMVILSRTRKGVVEKRTIPVRFVPLVRKPG